MSIDLSAEIIEAGARAEGDACLRGEGFDGYAEESREGFRRTSRRILEASAPLIEAAVRKQIAQDIQAEAAKQKRWSDESAAARGGVRSHHDGGKYLGLKMAAHIARGEQP